MKQYLEIIKFFHAEGSGVLIQDDIKLYYIDIIATDILSRITNYIASNIRKWMEEAPRGNPQKIKKYFYLHEDLFVVDILFAHVTKKKVMFVFRDTTQEEETALNQILTSRERQMLKYHLNLVDPHIIAYVFGIKKESVQRSINRIKKKIKNYLD